MNYLMKLRGLCIAQSKPVASRLKKVWNHLQVSHAESDFDLRDKITHKHMWVKKSCEQ